MLGVQQGTPYQETPKLPRDAQSFAELGDRGNTKGGMDLLAGAMHGYLDFIHSLVRCVLSALSEEPACGDQQCINRLVAPAPRGISWEYCWRGFSHELQYTRDIIPALLHS